MAKVKFKNYFKEDLVGILENGLPGPIVILMHGFCANKDENGLFKECAEYFSAHNINTMRFDVSGTGESSGDYQESTIRKQASELNSAIEYLGAPRNIGLVGFSLGAAVALCSSNPNICAYSFWSPAFFPSKDMLPRYDTLANNESLKNRGYFENRGLRIGLEMLNDLRNFDATDFLSSIVSPIQVVHGTEDPRISYESSIKVMDVINSGKELVLIEGANHSYKDNEDHRKQVFEKSCEWFKKYL